MLAQHAPPEEPLVFKTGASFVRVDVQALDRSKPIEGLSAADFIVYDDGVPQRIESFGRDAEPLQVLFVLDISGSMGRILTMMANVAQQALQALGPEDQVGVMLFARHARLSQELLTDHAPSLLALRQAPMERDLGSGTSLNQALLEAGSYFRTLPPFQGRRALVVLTDNGGLNERAPDEAVLRSLSEVNAVVNAIVSSKAKPPEPLPPGVTANPDYTPSDVFRLAAESGGEVLRADKPERLREMLERIRMRYSLVYRAPEAQPGSWRALRVELTPDARARFKKLELRFRPGYFAAP